MTKKYSVEKIDINKIRTGFRDLGQVDLRTQSSNWNIESKINERMAE
ncbi:MAG: hypothetical protein PHW04_01015 [Candidatus Wallbacteria bacterium]|nr:hypothetical protein [Candidatus Wallbacteria bacterium]